MTEHRTRQYACGCLPSFVGQDHNEVACMVDNRNIVHDWFELSYANYLVLPRILLQEMPSDWQRRFVACLNELNATWKPEAFPNYKVERVEGECERSCEPCDGGPDPFAVDCRCSGCECVVPDPLGEYRHPDMAMIDSLKVKR